MVFRSGVSCETRFYRPTEDLRTVDAFGDSIGRHRGTCDSSQLSQWQRKETAVSLEDDRNFYCASISGPQPGESSYAGMLVQLAAEIVH